LIRLLKKKRNKQINLIKSSITERSIEKTTIKHTEPTKRDENKFDKWLEYGKKWGDSKNEKIRKIKEFNLKKEHEYLKTDNYHKPLINSKSKQLNKINEKKDDKNKVPAFERLHSSKLIIKQKHEELVLSNTPSFSPIINSRYNKQNKHYYTPEYSNRSKSKNGKERSHSPKFYDVENIDDKNKLKTDQGFTRDSNREKTITVVSKTEGLNLLREKFNFKKSEKTTLDTENIINRNSRKFITIAIDNPETNKDMNENTIESKLYKLNVMDSMSCDQNKENLIIYKPTKKK